MITAYSDNVKIYYCSADSLPSLTESNYYKVDKVSGYEFVETPSLGCVAVGQGSVLRNLSSGDVYRYIISEIDPETLVQTGEWKKQP